MKKLIFLLGLLLFSCNPSGPDHEVNEQKPTQTEHSNYKSKRTEEFEVEEVEVCNCTLKEDFDDFHKADISFIKRKWEFDKLKFLKLDIDSLNKVTRSIRLIGFDTIPKELGSLENINTALVSTMDGITGLDVFPKLKVVRFWGSSKVSFDENETWLRRIEALRLEKTQITNLSSISLFENLKQLEVFHSGFEDLAPDFDELKCLNKLYVRAYIGDVIQLDKIDLRKMPCLKELYLLDVYRTLKGVPKNIKKSNLIDVYVKNESMTDLDKQLIEDFQSR
ncbi:MAG: hypothetical protein COA32_08995 [Fluviicola sp.]|nr:MAG: hypothetical protein COA32_08995 [Fluviicola sp.]